MIPRSARGNTSLDSTFRLTRELKKDINNFEAKIDEISTSVGPNPNVKSQHAALQMVQDYLNDILFRIEEAIPLISLALTTSGANLSARMPDSVSPGRYLQAGNFLRAADEKFESLTKSCKNPETTPIRVQVGPTFNLVLYTIFYGAVRNPSANDISWKEEHARCSVKLWRVNDLGAESIGDISGRMFDGDQLEYQYVMTVEESFKDGRYHDSDEKPKTRAIDISTVTRLFFSASGKLLQIEDSNSPVLILKINSAFDPFRNMTKEQGDQEDSDTESEGELSDPGEASFIYEEKHQHLAAAPEHIEWLAFEQYGMKELAEDYDTDSDIPSDEEPEEGPEDSLATNLKSLDIAGDAKNTSSPIASRSALPPQPQSSTEDKGSLSLMEYITRLAALQSNDQDSVYNITDERISLYLRDESATGTSGSRGAPTSTTNKDSPIREREAVGLPRNRRRSNITPAGSAPNSAKKGGHATKVSTRAKPGLADSPQTPLQFPAILKPKRDGSSADSSSSNPNRTPSPTKKAQTPAATPLTPWEKDRLKMRRQLLLLRKGSTDFDAVSSPIAKRLARTKNVSNKNSNPSSQSSVSEYDETETSLEDGYESPLKNRNTKSK